MTAMRLTPWEEERLLIFSAAELARRHRSAGLRLSHPEAVALICDAMLEAARAGGSYEDVERAGRTAIREDELIDGVRALLDEVRLEVLLGDGSRLVVLVDPLGAIDPLAPGPPAAGAEASAGAVGIQPGPEATGGGRT
jgi:urease subunit gamma/beta